MVCVFTHTTTKFLWLLRNSLSHILKLLVIENTDILALLPTYLAIRSSNCIDIDTASVNIIEKSLRDTFQGAKWREPPAHLDSTKYSAFCILKRPESYLGEVTRLISDIPQPSYPRDPYIKRNWMADFPDLRSRFQFVMKF